MAIQPKIAQKWPKNTFFGQKSKFREKFFFLRLDLVEGIAIVILSHRSSLQVLWFGLRSRTSEISLKPIFAPLRECLFGIKDSSVLLASLVLRSIGQAERENGGIFDSEQPINAATMELRFRDYSKTIPRGRKPLCTSFQAVWRRFMGCFGHFFLYRLAKQNLT